jgi:PhoPQ-activated pathogenicity-related protein
MNTGKTDWIQQLPMVKGAIKCIDSVKHFLLTNKGIKVEKYVVAGASKRGWTTW